MVGMRNGVCFYLMKHGRFGLGWVLLGHCRCCRYSKYQWRSMQSASLQGRWAKIASFVRGSGRGLLIDCGTLDAGLVKLTPYGDVV